MKSAIIKYPILALSLLAAGSLANAETVPTGLAGHWNFDTATTCPSVAPAGSTLSPQTVCDDLSAHNGKNYGATTGVAGVLGSAYSFDGDDGVTIDNHGLALSPGAGDFTVSTWVKMGTTDGVIFMNYSGLIYTAIYGRSVGGVLLGFSRDGTGTASLVYSTTDLRDDRWHHVAYVRSGNVFQMYVDCALEGTGTATLGSVSSASPWLHVGGTNTGCSGCTQDHWATPADGFFTGAIDELALYNRALSPAEVTLNGTNTTIACGDDVVNDSDDDGVLDIDDNCPAIANPGQEDLDNDLLGDDCDDDDDGDGVLDVTDNCACEVNADQSDLDQDGIGDACDNSFEGSNLVDDVDATASEASDQITASGVSGSSGLITKIQGNPNGNGSGSNSVAAIVAAAVGDYFAGYIDCATYVSWLQDALDRLTTFDNQLAGKIGNGSNQISAEEAAPIQELSAELRALIQLLIDNAC